MNLRYELGLVVDAIEKKEQPCSEIVCELRSLCRSFDYEGEDDPLTEVVWVESASMTTAQRYSPDFAEIPKVEGAGTG